MLPELCKLVELVNWDLKMIAQMILVRWVLGRVAEEIREVRAIWSSWVIKDM